MTESEDYTKQDLKKYYGKDNAFDFEYLLDDAYLNVAMLHVGCGSGEIMTKSREHWDGVDFNENLHYLWDELDVSARTGDVRDMHWISPEQYDYTFSVDFFEHLKPEDVPKVVAELTRVAPHGIHVIDRAPLSYFRGTGNKNLHPSGGLCGDEWLAHFPTHATMTQTKRHVTIKW